MTDQSPALRPLLARFEPSWPAVLEVGAGWHPLLVELDEALSRLAPRYVVQQVKSKFGSLSFYATPSPDPYHYDEDFQQAIRAAEWRSIEICEECGAPAGQYTMQLWVWTLCADHAEARRASASTS